ncbi:hypothetical protein RPMA_09935 [Tardiphaga alba]|uniref:Aminoglycoside N(3)-acetyltransferase n=1 Tax=Tardiphaga alba TaxID=340268 RepID=A0ABX8A5W6_9BRAD|nr:hypothetical protein RPMA_09935 [Tardiphaga alba]
MDDSGKPHRMIIATRQSIAENLASLGVETGDTLCVYSSMSALGLVIGEARAVVEALVNAVISNGTIMMTACSGTFQIQLIRRVLQSEHDSSGRNRRSRPSSLEIRSRSWPKDCLDPLRCISRARSRHFRGRLL